MPEEGLWGFVLSLGAGTCETPIRRWQHGWRSEDTEAKGWQRKGWAQTTGGTFFLLEERFSQDAAGHGGLEDLVGEC